MTTTDDMLNFPIIPEKPTFHFNVKREKGNQIIKEKDTRNYFFRRLFLRKNLQVSDFVDFSYDLDEKGCIDDQFPHCCYIHNVNYFHSSSDMIASSCCRGFGGLLAAVVVGFVAEKGFGGMVKFSPSPSKI